MPDKRAGIHDRRVGDRGSEPSSAIFADGSPERRFVVAHPGTTYHKAERVGENTERDGKGSKDPYWDWIR
jgi:hypothetical protein